MGRRDEFHGVVDPSKGAPGNYTLNQKAQKFSDRRTKRNRDRSTNRRNDIERSRRGE